MEMEEEIDSLFENMTERPKVDDNTIPTSIYILRYLQILICLLGFLLNILIVFIVLRSKQMRTKTNLIFMNRCIYDFLYLVLDFVYFFIHLLYGEAIYNHNILICFRRYTTAVVEMAMCGFTLILLSNRLMNTNGVVSTRTLLSFGNLTVLVYFTAQVIQCLHECSSRHVIEGVVGLTLGVLLLLVTLTKDINRCRQNANIPISKDSSFRLNIARILTYNWTICFFFDLLPLPYLLWSFFGMWMSLNAVSTFIYVFCSDEAYKTRILNVLNFDFDLDKQDNVLEDCDQTTLRNRSSYDFNLLDIVENDA